MMWGKESYYVYRMCVDLTVYTQTVFDVYVDCVGILSYIVYIQTHIW